MTTTRRATERLDGWWHARFDENAAWEDEAPCPPSQAASSLGVAHEPSMGWRHLEEEMESLRVPGTWEAARPGYRGVAWHWRPLVVPGEWDARRVHLRVGGARLRAEVYLDEALVGYDLDGATPFEVDLTPYLRPDRRHELALRVTHPGGWRDARQVAPIRWGGCALPPGPDVGGVWGRVALVGRPDPFIERLSVYPSDEADALVTQGWIRHDGGSSASLRLVARDARGDVVGETARDIEFVGSGSRRVDALLALGEAPRWQPDAPSLVTVEAQLASPSGIDAVTVTTGLRHMALHASGLRLNGARCPLRGALTAGFYPLDWIIPRGALADAEARAARALGLNALVAWHQPLHPDLLAAADRHGLLLAQTMGLGRLEGHDAPYAELARDRVRRVIFRDGHHPSIVAWYLGDDASTRGGPSPLLLDLLAVARDADPSRPIVWGADGGRVLGVNPHGEQEVCLALGERRLWSSVDAADGPSERIALVQMPRILPDLPDLAARYGARGMPGSDAHAYRHWARALQEEFDAGSVETVDDLSAYCRATWPTQRTVDRALGADKSSAGAAALIESWSGATPLDAASLVDPFRRPKVREDEPRDEAHRDG